MIRVGFDVGGSFTDFVVKMDTPEGEKTEYFKVSSTPHDPSEGIENGLREILTTLALDPKDLSFVGHGTTVATNMVIERKGVKLALITTKGFRDVLEVARQVRPNLYDYSVEKSAPLVTRDLRFEVSERINALGEVTVALDEACIVELAALIREAGAQAVAVCLLHSHKNPVHEQRIGALLAEHLPGVYVSLSSAILPEFREYERFSTTAINAYVGPKMDLYLQRFLERLETLGITALPQTIHSNGGLMSVESVRQFPVRTCLSGPAAGVMGAAKLASAAGFKDILTFDVGGTSTDVSLVADGQPALAQGREVAGLPVKVPMIDIDAIGAGGGSIAWLDQAGSLKVGPHSAGAFPGPVAYGVGGTEPTVTDANLVLGRLNPKGLLQGKLKIDIEAARQAINDKVAAPLGLSIEEAAEGIIQIAVSNMTRAIRSISTERGYDPSNFALFAFGGAGPLHAPAVAIEAEMDTVVVPVQPGTLCARGILLSDISFDFVASDLFAVDAENWPRLALHHANLTAQGRNWLTQEAVGAGDVSFEFSVDARYRGQNYELNIPLEAVENVSEADFIALFHATHRQIHGYDIPGRDLECVNLRLKVRAKVAGQSLVPALGTSSEPQPADCRPVYLSGAWHEVPVYKRESLPAGTELSGPVIIEEMSSTSIISVGQTGRIDDHLNIVIGVRA